MKTKMIVLALALMTAFAGVAILAEQSDATATEGPVNTSGVSADGKMTVTYYDSNGKASPDDWGAHMVVTYSGNIDSNWVKIQIYEDAEVAYEVLQPTASMYNIDVTIPAGDYDVKIWSVDEGKLVSGAAVSITVDENWALILNPNGGKWADETTGTKTSNQAVGSYISMTPSGGVAFTNPTKLGYTLTSWNTQADGNGITVVADLTTLKSTPDTTLYAIYEENSYEIFASIANTTYGTPIQNGTAAKYTDAITIAGNKITVGDAIIDIVPVKDSAGNNAFTAYTVALQEVTVTNGDAVSKAGIIQGNTPAGATLNLVITLEPTKYTVTLAKNQNAWGTIKESGTEVSSVAQVPYGTAYTVSGQTVTMLGKNYVAEKTAAEGKVYFNGGWDVVSGTITGAVTFTASFDMKLVINIEAKDSAGIPVAVPYLMPDSESSKTVSAHSGSKINVDDVSIVISDTDGTVTKFTYEMPADTPESTWSFVGWQQTNGDPFNDGYTVSEPITVIAKFLKSSTENAIVVMFNGEDPIDPSYVFPQTDGSSTVKGGEYKFTISEEIQLVYQKFVVKAATATDVGAEGFDWDDVSPITPVNGVYSVAVTETMYIMITAEQVVRNLVVSIVDGNGAPIEGLSVLVGASQYYGVSADIPTVKIVNATGKVYEYAFKIDNDAAALGTDYSRVSHGVYSLDALTDSADHEVVITATVKSAASIAESDFDFYVKSAGTNAVSVYLGSANGGLLAGTVSISGVYYKVTEGVKYYGTINHPWQGEDAKVKCGNDTKPAIVADGSDYDLSFAASNNVTLYSIEANYKTTDDSILDLKTKTILIGV